MNIKNETSVTIRPFVVEDAEVFRSLNEAWIERYFELEEKDRKTFADPQGSILGQGGHILMASLFEETVGSCALLAMGDDQFELAKMAVSEAHQGRGIGRSLLEAGIELAKQLGAKRLYLETNRRLGTAIALYRSVGFRDLDPALVEPSPYTRADVYMELFLHSR